MRRTGSLKTAAKGPSTIRDAYGFEVPQSLAGLYCEHSAAWNAEEKRRTDKWLQFLKDICPTEHQTKHVMFAGFWDAVVEESLTRVVVEHKSVPDGTETGERLDGLVRLGIPSFLRGYAWGLFLGYDSERIPGLYKLLSMQPAPSHRPAHQTSIPTEDASARKNLMTAFSSSSDRELEVLDENDAFNAPSFFQCEQSLEQIRKDLDRTFPGHPLMDESGKETLRQILMAFSLHRPDIGYCQGMNFITGLLLLYHQPEDAFWNLASIIEHLLPNQFDRDMLPAVVDKLVFSHLVQEHFPDLAQHLDELAVDVSYLCPHWFLCCFVNALPMETCLRVWDILFWERKPNILFKVALALVDFYSQDLMEIQNAAAAWEQLQKMAASFFDSSRLIETACLKFSIVDEVHIGELRSTYLNRIKEQNLLGKGSNFGAEDGSTTTTPTKILAASASLVRGRPAFSSSSSSSASNFEERAAHDIVGSLRNDDNQRIVRQIMAQLQESNEGVPDDLVSNIHELIDRLIETETAGHEMRSKAESSHKEIAKANEMNRSLKNRLGAVYEELDKKNECLDRMIAKCQVLTEKVASQEEVICKQRRILFSSDSPCTTGSGQPAVVTQTMNTPDRGTQSLKNLFALRR